ncbi:hypothetical protein AAW51_2969 [Caldimonas brevitalea]|uniref:Uncharacterized protein n=1 Tax=Caldimonas brevitalea TaxID=413882 RepID=A0A0G3BT02_9BURK|nr:hypothetical protein AAW51_2969 [Caldimonas brevitalea]
MLADLRRHDAEGSAWLERQLDVVNELLGAHGWPLHQEPQRLAARPSRCARAVYPYAWLHHLRRAYAYAAADPDVVLAPATDAGDEPVDDAVLHAETERLESHLLCHSDCEGFYVPVDFGDLIFDASGRLAGGMLGSSYRLLGELVLVAPYIGVELQGGVLSDEEAARLNALADRREGHWVEGLVWLSLYEAATASVDQKTAIAFA